MKVDQAHIVKRLLNYSSKHKNQKRNKQNCTSHKIKTEKCVCINIINSCSPTDTKKKGA